MNFFSRRLIYLQIKNFAHVPSIKFRGGFNKQQDKHSQPENSSTVQTTKQTLHIVDNLRAVEVSLRYRTSLSNEEIESINIGGPIKLGNWQNIKLKKKK